LVFRARTGSLNGFGRALIAVVRLEPLLHNERQPLTVNQLGVVIALSITRVCWLARVS